jgi:DNA invertase Pin-like site-specific DNA recombinase
MGRPKGKNPINLKKIKTAFEKGLSIAETVKLTGISISSVKRYRRALEEN